MNKQQVRESLHKRVAEFLAAGGAPTICPPQQPQKRATKLRLTPDAGTREYQKFVSELEVGSVG